MSTRSRGWAAIATGLCALLALAAMAYRDSRDVAPAFPMAVLVVVGLAAVALLAIGVSLLAGARDGRAQEPASYRHTLRPFGVLGALFVAAFTARALAVPDDFGRDGPYRAGARDDAAQARKPRYQGAAACLECHAPENQETGKDVHHTVQCETCHGPGDAHVAAPREQHLTVDAGADACLVCHRKLTARPGPFPQINPPDHFRLVGVKESGVACTRCHDPHQPIFLTKPVTEARLHPLVHRCRDCHVNRTDETLERPAAHPAIFECGTCHAAVAADAKGRRHADVACTTCHLFIRESDFAGRIVRNTDPRFCLLCHRAADFRREGGPATIDWDEHRKTYDDTLPATAPCTPCHLDTVHAERSPG